VVETLLLFAELKHCRYPVLFAPVGAAAQPANEAVQFAAAPSPDTEEVTTVLLAPGVAAMTAAVELNVSVTVALNNETVEDS
jgi:hypothetical protein